MHTTIVLCLIAFALSIDYSVGLITLQAYWKHVHGAESLFGVIFGLYDGFVIIVTPAIAWLLNNTKLKYKFVFIVGLLLNIIGNVVYSFAFALDTWVLILLGRAVSGIGASVVPLLIMYVAMVMNGESQKPAVGYIKYTAAITRVIGPVLGILLALIKTTNHFFNEYTVTGWIPAFICVVVLVIVLFWKEDEPAPSLLPAEQKNENTGYLEIIKIFLPIISLGFITTFIYWYFVGNGYVMALHRYHIIHNSHDPGNWYYPGIGSFVLAFGLFYFFQDFMSGNIGLCMSSIGLFITSTFFLCKLDVIFYIAVGLTTFCYAVLVPSINIQNNLLARRHKNLLGNIMGVSIVALAVFQSVARFVGPACFMLFKDVVRTPDCNITDPEHYNVTGCKIEGYIPSSMGFIIGSFVITVICLYLSIRMATPKEPNSENSVQSV